ncbi:hypothetical protein P7K49_024221 [Saguinus oedipus]|uniref:Uncharacterized protein n=1 Tax=Saguinus oedipus TaxID=9490 RepID=A0ABQ9UPN4_SAGOE|nr:hypothetical protein P7K49_024221 [Saguinus oedipus]
MSSSQVIWNTLAATKPMQVDTHYGCTATIAQDCCHLSASIASQIISEAHPSALLLFRPAVSPPHSYRPMIEFCIPSSLDPTLAPAGCHVVSLFTQYTPYKLAGGKAWDEQERNAYADRGKESGTFCLQSHSRALFDCIEAYAPGFKDSVVGRDILTPPDLERIFGLPGGVRISLGGLPHSLLSAPHFLAVSSLFILSLYTQLASGRRTVTGTPAERRQRSGQSREWGVPSGDSEPRQDSPTGKVTRIVALCLDNHAGSAT